MDKPVELRGPVPQSVIDILDAYSMARKMSRIDLVNVILKEWSDRRVHETSLIINVARGNPDLSESLGLDRK